MSDVKDKQAVETAEQKELRELREKNAKLEKELDSFLSDSPVLPSNTGGFPDNITVFILDRDEHRNPIKYREIEVPEILAHEQLALPPSERNAHWRDVCYKKDADPRFFN